MEQKLNTLIVRKDDGIATVIMNRPPYNGMNEAMFGEMVPLFRELDDDDAVKVVVLTGAGKYFSVGGDLSSGEGREQALDSSNGEQARRALLWTHRAVRQIHSMEKPWIAMINGAAAGGGMDYALACDIRIAAENAVFRSFTQIGVIPGQAGAWFMVHNMGYAKACEMLFTARKMTAREAERAGLVNKVVPLPDLERETMELARTIAQQAPIAVRLCKLLCRKALETSVDTAWEMAALSQGICLPSEDGQEAIHAFMEKRTPVFKGR